MRTHAHTHTDTHRLLCMCVHGRLRMCVVNLLTEVLNRHNNVGWRRERERERTCLWRCWSMCDCVIARMCGVVGTCYKTHFEDRGRRQG